MKTLALATICATALLAGCATKTRSIDLAGMYASESGTLAIGRIEVQSSPEGVESAAIRYTEDTAWLSPTTKTHSIKILLTGTNAVNSAEGIVTSICGAFTAQTAAKPSTTTDVKPDVDLHYNDAVGKGGDAASVFLSALTTECFAAVKAATANKQNGTITVQTTDGKIETLDCENGTCTTSSGVKITSENCESCTVK